MSEPLDEIEFLARSENRVAVLEALSDGPAARRDLQVDLDVGRVTLGRILADFEDRGWVTADGEYRATFPGKLVAEEFLGLRAFMAVAGGLGELAGALPVEELGVAPDRLRDATVTTATSGDPYRPVRRFMDLLRESTTLRGFDTTTIAPMYVDEIGTEIGGGMTTSVIYEPQVAEQLAAHYGEVLAGALDRGNLDLFVGEDLQFGLAVFDERVGIGAYDADSGTLSVFVDTDDPVVREWAVERYEAARDAATPLEEWLEDGL